MLARRRWLAGELGLLDEAEALARQGLAVAADDPDAWTARAHAVFCFSHLCELAWQRGDRAGLEESARVGEELARMTSHQLELAEFLTWQGLLAREAGDAERAARLFRLGARRVAQLGMPPDHIYFDAACAYHEQAGEWEQALALRRRELELLEGKGRWAAECRCRVRLCRLLRRLGLAVAEEVERGQEAAGRLRFPQQTLAELARLS